MNIRNAAFNAEGGIDCELQHAVFGWVPFTASAIDPEQIGREVFAAALALGPAAYVPPPQPEPVAQGEPVLPPARFEWLLAFTGLEAVWAALESALRDRDRAAYAMLRAQRAKGAFHLPVTLALVEQFRPVAEAAAPGTDLSEDAIRAAWALAAGVEL